MKASAPSIGAASLGEKTRWAVLSELFKARLTFLVLLTALVGFYAGSSGTVDLGLLGSMLLGTGLLACGAAALNQYWEREYDARMRRTESRPIPSGRLQPETVLVAGSICSVAGIVWLGAMVNLLTCLIGVLTLLTYLFIYTPLKRVTWLNTVVGAVPGGLPPLMGWTAAGNGLGWEGWSLFAILFFWQMPHFLAIAWLYREDYGRAGFVMLPNIDPAGRRTGFQSVSYTVAVVLASFAPAFLGMAGSLYLAGTVVLGIGFLVFAWQFSRQLTLARARKLFFCSILYLPLVLGLMVLDKVR